MIKNFGGVWADSTLYCQTPLDDWIFEYLDNSFFGFRNPHPDRIIANWFMASEKESAIVNKWYQAIIEYFSSRDKDHLHFWHHYLFKNLYNSDTQFKQIWDNLKPFECANPRVFQKDHLCDYGPLLFAPFDDKKLKVDNKQLYDWFIQNEDHLSNFIKTSNVPMYKLSWRIAPGNILTRIKKSLELK